MSVDRKQYTANEGEARHPAGDVPGLQGCYYITAGTETLANGMRVGVPGKGSVLALDSCAPSTGVVVTWLFFVDDGGNLRRLGQVAKSSVTTLAPGDVLPGIPMPNTNSDGVVVGP